MALLNRFVIHGHAVGLGHEIHAERAILLCMNALGKPNTMQMNTDRLAKAHAEMKGIARKPKDVICLDSGSFVLIKVLFVFCSLYLHLIYYFTTAAAIHTGI